MTTCDSCFHHSSITPTPPPTATVEPVSISQSPGQSHSDRHDIEQISSFLTPGECIKLLSFSVSCSGSQNHTWGPHPRLVTKKKQQQQHERNSENDNTDLMPVQHSCGHIFYQAPTSLTHAMLERLKALQVPGVEEIMEEGAGAGAGAGAGSSRPRWTLERLDSTFHFLRYAPEETEDKDEDDDDDDDGDDDGDCTRGAHSTNGNVHREDDGQDSERRKGRKNNGHDGEQDHQDQVEERTLAVLQIYLNGGDKEDGGDGEVIDGGATRFSRVLLLPADQERRRRDQGHHPSVDISPVAGRALVFRRSSEMRWKEELVERGVKYSVRIGLVYRRANFD